MFVVEVGRVAVEIGDVFVVALVVTQWNAKAIVIAVVVLHPMIEIELVAPVVGVVAVVVIVVSET